jgi:hypothetical protein
MFSAVLTTRLALVAPPLEELELPNPEAVEPGRQLGFAVGHAKSTKKLMVIVEITEIVCVSFFTKNLVGSRYVIGCH